MHDTAYDTTITTSLNRKGGSMRLATMESNIHISLDYVTTFIVGSNISVVSCKASFLRLQTHIALGHVMLQ